MTTPALQFNGSSQYAQSIAPPMLITGKFSVEIWARYNTQAQSCIWVNWNGGYTGTFLWAYYSSGRAYVRAGDNVANALNLQPNALDANFHHLAVTVGGLGGQLRYYVDGILTLSGTIGAWIPVLIGNSNMPLLLAAFPAYNRFLNGAIEDFRVWTVELDQPTIAQWMTKRVWSAHPNYSTLALYWKIDEGTGSLLHDSSGNNFSGNTYNAPIWTTGVDLAKAPEGIGAGVGGGGKFANSLSAQIAQSQAGGGIITPSRGFNGGTSGARTGPGSAAGAMSQSRLIRGRSLNGTPYRSN